MTDDRSETRPDWLHEGAVVAVESYHPDRVDLDTVERFTATRVVLKSGRWFPLKTLIKHRPGSWGGADYLKDANDAGVVRKIRFQQTHALIAALDRAGRTLSLNSTDEERAEIARLATKLAEWVAP
ncbi:hypothetical protein [Terrabacter sp. C0L_2]|uniref:hypothetical protein n=1 Tax=Terrabacter sp. C0L_2 TaxID=3108389 RepID=UPI002ED5A43E|nr:hypothetical protein U5C87_17665 [Terrabacter sp. C0L_2]